jgi:hypothetical protein
MQLPYVVRPEGWPSPHYVVKVVPRLLWISVCVRGGFIVCDVVTCRGGRQP